MSDPFVAEIRAVGFNFAPTGWARCSGQLLPLSQNTALFSLLGTYYGGDGKSTFALPNLEGSTAIHHGQSTTGTEYFLGETSGSTSVTLLQSEMPAHTHTLRASGEPAEQAAPAPDRALTRSTGLPYRATGTDAVMAPQALSTYGGSLPHNNMAPYLTVGFCIALQGVFPPRT